MKLVAPKLAPMLLVTVTLLMGCGNSLQPALSPTEPRPSIPRPYYADIGVESEDVSLEEAMKVSFKNDIVPIMKQHCASCHSPGGPGAQEHLFFDARGEASYRAIGRNASHVVNAIESGLMPPGKPEALSPEELKLIKAWRYAGAPLN